MEIALVVGFSILLALAIASSSLIYSYYIYSKNRVFSKTKYSILWIVIISLIIIMMMVSGILFNLTKDLEQAIKYSNVCVGLSFSIMAIAIIYLIALCLIPMLTNKNKIPYDQILKVDYKTLINQLLVKIGDLEQLKKTISSKNKKYYHTMLSYYENILKRAKNEKISLVEKTADIVTFNDAFTHKWCTFTNNLQLLMTYQFCEAISKKS